VLLISVGNTERDNVGLQTISKFVLLVSVQLHVVKLEHKFVKIDEWTDDYN